MLRAEDVPGEVAGRHNAWVSTHLNVESANARGDDVGRPKDRFEEVE